MITLEQYFGPWLRHADATPVKQKNAETMLVAVNGLMAEAEADGVVFFTNPSTDSQVSGTQQGGFRPRLSTQGAPNSSHKEGTGVDLFDPHNKIDEWCMKNLDKLEKYGIYIEHPSATHSWSHWTTRKPHSGNRVFYP